MTKIAKGTWVEIEQVVLAPQDRAPTLPEDTRQVPYMLRASGFLLDDAELGQSVRIRTRIGRDLEGTLREANPGYSHSFGTTVPELLMIGTEADR